MQPLVFDKSPLTLDEFISINWKYLRKSRKSWFVIPIFLLIVFTINSCNIIVGTRGFENARTSDAFLPIGLYALFFGFLYYTFVKGFKKNYFNTPDLLDGLSYTLSNDSISVQGNIVNSIQPWPVSFKRAIKIGKWILLSSSGTAAYFLNIEKLAAPATLTDVKELLQSKGIQLEE